MIGSEASAPVASAHPGRPRVTAFDMDGVLFDSAQECMHVLSRTVPTPPSANHGERWVAERWRAQVVADFFPLLDAIVAEQTLPADGRVPGPRASDACVRAFYETREAIYRRDPSSWLDLHPVYAGVSDLVSRAARAGPTLVTTAKDTTSARRLIRHFGLAIETEFVRGRDESPEKVDLLRWGARRFGVDASDVMLIDDHLGNCRAARDAGFRVALASWGYNSADQRLAAEREGIAVVTVADLATAFADD